MFVSSWLPETLVEGVAGAADGADGVGFATTVDGAAEAADMDVDGALIDIDVIAPDAIEELLARIDAAGMAHEIFEEAIFGGAQMHVAGGAADAVGGAIELKVADLEGSSDEIGIGAAEEGVDARDQLGDREGFYDIVVGAGREAPHALFFFAAGGEHDDGDARGLFARPDPPAEFDAGN